MEFESHLGFTNVADKWCFKVVRLLEAREFNVQHYDIWSGCFLERNPDVVKVRGNTKRFDKINMS